MPLLWRFYLFQLMNINILRSQYDVIMVNVLVTFVSVMMVGKQIHQTFLLVIQNLCITGVM
jgi:hypothetical protein